MATNIESTHASSADDSSSCTLECPVCLQPCVHPVQLECRHIFCFLCVKGVAIQSKKCPMCRTLIPPNYLDNPKLVAPVMIKPSETSEGTSEVDESGSYRWYYEGRNGWWQYDQRTNDELESHYKRGDKTCELLIAGFLYVVDLEAMVQHRRNEPQRRRMIRRDHVGIPLLKGVAGIRIPQVSSSADNDLSSTVDNLMRNLSIQDGNDDEEEEEEEEERSPNNSHRISLRRRAETQ